MFIIGNNTGHKFGLYKNFSWSFPDLLPKWCREYCFYIHYKYFCITSSCGRCKRKKHIHSQWPITDRSVAKLVLLLLCNVSNYMLKLSNALLYIWDGQLVVRWWSGHETMQSWRNSSLVDIGRAIIIKCRPNSSICYSGSV